MVNQPTQRVSNQILLSLSTGDLATLWPLLTPVTLMANQRLELPGQPIRYVYFIESGIASVVATIRGRHRTEVSMIGPEGATGSELLLGDEQAELETFIQMPGSALRIDLDDFQQAMAAMPTLRALMLRNTRALLTQVAFTTLANTHGSIEERLARSLLMMHDRFAGDQIDITHGFLAIKLATRRPGITTALHVLEGKHCIRCTRGHIAVLDRAGLISAAAGTYVAPKAHIALAYSVV